MKNIMIVSAGLLLFMMSCSSSRVLTSWKTDKPYSDIKKVLVLGLTGELDRDFCVKMEKHLVNDLSQKGFDAVAAYDEYGPGSFDSLQEKEAVEKIRNKGFDAVITIVLLNTQKEKIYVQIRPKNRLPFEDEFWSYYTSQFDKVYHKDYYATATKYFWESNLYELSSNTLIYTSRTESFDPINAASLAHEYGRLISEDMIVKGIFPVSAKKAF